MRSYLVVLVSILAAAIVVGMASTLIWPKPESPNAQRDIGAQPQPTILRETDLNHIGPRMNLPQDTPHAYGFWSFSILDSGNISRSGQPRLAEFRWLRDRGWRSVVNLRVSDEYDEIGDDAEIPGFNELGFNYLHLPIPDGGAPSLEQAQAFLKFVTDPDNQPVEVHCRGGYGRTGTMIALYRYEVERWPMREAIAESRLYHGGIASSQERWLLIWAEAATSET